MSDFLQLLLALVIIIAGAKLAGLLSTRLGQPAVLGELMAGLVLGPTLLNIFGWSFFTNSHLQETVFELAELGVILLMFIAGLEIDLGEMRKSGKVAIFAGVLGVLTPLALGFGAALPFGYDAQQALFVGVLLTATSVSISAQTLLELGRLRSRVGLALLGAAVIDDVLVILVLSLFVALASGGGSVMDVLLIIARMALFLVGAVLLGLWLFPRLINRVSRWPVSQPVLTTAIVMALLLSWSAEVIGAVAAITGAFLAGMMFARTTFQHQIEEGASRMAYSFFVPIFFASIGLHTNARLLDGNLIWFTLLICVVAIVSKLIGSGLGARLAGMNNRESIQVGTGMISRGEVGLIVASVGIAEGLIAEELFAVTVVMVLVTTLATPLLLRLVFREPTSHDGRTANDERTSPAKSEA
ncbi:MAG TPA: cation:proton antiporter [Roseiflexaceae bacterium]|nr:cation:proton antiporter [Roseiflexaceae bacterium]